jgi:uncharacterized protein YbaR (Trm112 family)
MERINPYTDHRLEITCRDDKLVIRKKPGQIVEPETVELYEHRVKPFLTRELIPKRPFAFHVRYYWNEKIDFSVVNPDADASWTPVGGTEQTEAPVPGVKARLQAYVLDLARSALSQKQRNIKINLLDLLLCPNCGSVALSAIPDGIRCNDCATVYPVRQGIPSMFPQSVANKGEANS